MIVDLPRYVATEKPYWDELDSLLKRFEDDSFLTITFDDAQRLHYLYQRTLSALAKIGQFAAEPELKRYLETLAGRAYARMHETRSRRAVINPWRWFTRTFPRAFRRRVHAFYLALAITMLGCAFGCLALAVDRDAKQDLLPFDGLHGSPSERVQQEEKDRGQHLNDAKATFSGQLMTNNIKVSFFTMALGLTWGIGTFISLFYNGVILGAVCFDYVIDGQAKFLAGWLLPHGSVEIPSILLAGQAGFLIASALIGWGQRNTMRERFRELVPDLTAIILAAALILVWAGIIEAFFSQYHEPVLPYSVKITFGLVQLIALFVFLARSGRKLTKEELDAL